MTKLSEKFVSSPATSAIIEANKGDLLLHVVKQGSPDVSYAVEDKKILTQVFADAAARALAVPGFVGQLGVQLDTGTQYRSNGITAGDWTEAIGCKIYRAILLDEGAGPVVTVLENTIGAIVWGGSGGAYTATLASAFTENKTFLVASSNYSVVDGWYFVGISRGNANVINVSTAYGGGWTLMAISDIGATAGVSIEIRVYP